MFKQSIQTKILSVAIAVTVIGFSVLIYTVISHEKKSLLEERKNSSRLMAEPVLIAIYEDMLDERADMVRYLVENIKKIKGTERVQVIKSNGVEEAFRDFKTLKAVEKEYGKLKPEWVENHPNKEKNVADGTEYSGFREAIRLFAQGRKQEISYIEEHGNKHLFTYLAPIEARPKCNACHATAEEARGVLMISTSLEDMYAGIASSKARWITYGFLTITGVSLLLALIIRNIIRPLKAMISSAQEIASGNFSISIPVYTKDEVGELARSFNKMAGEIGERRSAMQSSEKSFANAQRIAHLGNWDWNIIKNEIHWSDEIYRIFGLTPQEFGATYEAFLNFVHPDDREFVKKYVNEALYERKRYSIDHRIVRPDGAERIVHEQAEVTFDETSRAVQMVGTVHDITEQKKAEMEIRKLSTVIEQSINIVFTTDIKGDIEYVNPMFESVTGWSKHEVIGKNPRILASGLTTKAQYKELWDTILAGKIFRYAFQNKKKNGQLYWANGLISPIKNRAGGITHFLAIQEDITEKKKAEERVEYLAVYDELTGLYNRVRFMELTDKWIDDAKSSDRRSALLLIDIDEFKSINAIYGHNIGDEFLRHAAGLLKNSMEDIHREGVLAHLGGDEFAVFITDIGEKDAVNIAEVVRRKIEGLYFTPLTTRFTASIGIALYPEHGAAVRELLSRADIAMYRAKASGRNRCHLYQPEDHDLEKIHSRLREKELIQNALNQDRFEPWFQPILDLKGNKIHHCEALARMRGEDGAILLPGAFIDTAEIFGLVGAIDRIIIEKTMRLQAAMSSQGSSLSFGMNLSGKDLEDGEILFFMRDKIRETGADPGRLIFEITETAAIHDMDKAVKFIKALKSIGCHFSLDDFGVGFTSFIYLREMGVDYIKIDGSFIKRLHKDENDRLFVKAIVDVAKGMGIKTVAEFVENEEIIELLRNIGVDYAQGYAIGKPAPWKEIKLED